MPSEVVPWLALRAGRALQACDHVHAFFHARTRERTRGRVRERDRAHVRVRARP